MLAVELITRAFYLSGVVSRNLESLQADELYDGVNLLNDVLSEVNVTGRYVPYFSYIDINCVVGQEIYFIPNAVDIFTATFNIGPVRYEMYHDDLRHYFGAPRVDNINALPFNWFWERVNGGINVYVYFLPSSDSWILKFKCKIGLSNVVENTDLSLTYDDFYQLFLRYKLVDYICDWYGITMPPQVESKLKSFETIYANLNANDYSIKKVSTYSITDSLTYAQANLGKGWTAP
ncbi:MAG TPA: hypothetical protein VHZ76_00965 [Gammaproteobacteria bacterium]|jgi:hypothetical protein|nr:hypothetical protein [Gammaproteobacteria bacterium]